jgi:hypothetical protein
VNANTEPEKLPFCGFCFGPIRDEPHVKRGRTYHPPKFVFGQWKGGCAELDKPGSVIKKPVAISTNQLSLDCALTDGSPSAAP